MRFSRCRKCSRCPLWDASGTPRHSGAAERGAREDLRPLLRASRRRRRCLRGVTSMLPEPERAVLLAMSHERRAAFAAGVTERVLDLYMDCATPYRGNVWEAITLAWDRAAGVAVPEETATRLAKALDQ